MNVAFRKHSRFAREYVIVLGQAGLVFAAGILLGLLLMKSIMPSLGKEAVLDRYALVAGFVLIAMLCRWVAALRAELRMLKHGGLDESR